MKSTPCPVGILSGGLGTRLAEETDVLPKPMVRVGTQPLLWHIMKWYAAFGHSEFHVALGYKGDVIKNFFINYRALSANVCVDLATGQTTFASEPKERWRVHLHDTGLNTQTGGRIRALLQAAGGRMLVTYGDGIGDVSIERLIAFHEACGKLATVTAVRPPSRFGELAIEGDAVVRFSEKPQIGEGWINGGFFVLEPGVLDYIDGPDTLFEGQPLERLAADGQLAAFRHDAFWQCMDTLRDVRTLNKLWHEGIAPWKSWQD